MTVKGKKEQQTFITQRNDKNKNNCDHGPQAARRIKGEKERERQRESRILLRNDQLLRDWLCQKVQKVQMLI